jgi:hypothetical protein
VLAAAVEDVGPGAWMELMDEMTSRKLKTPYIAEGAFLMGGGLPVETTIPQGRPAAVCLSRWARNGPGYLPAPLARRYDRPNSSRVS